MVDKLGSRTTSCRIYVWTMVGLEELKIFIMH